MKEAIYDRKIDPGQYIGLPGRDYSSIMTFEELRFEYTRLKRFPFSYFDNNLASWYDRILLFIASLCVIIYGIYQDIVFIYATTLEEAEFKWKTGYKAS